MTTATARMREPEPVTVLRAHLALRMDADYAAWMARSLAELCRSIQSSDRWVRDRQRFAMLYDDASLAQLKSDTERLLVATNMCPPHRRRGRPRDWYGPGLVRWINDYYPPTIGRKYRITGGRRAKADEFAHCVQTAESHFAKTVRLVFEIAGLDTPEKDLTDKIVHALRGIKNPTPRARFIEHCWLISPDHFT